MDSKDIMRRVVVTDFAMDSKEIAKRVANCDSAKFTFFSLVNYDLHDASAFALADALSTGGYSIKRLYLNCNQFGPKGVAAIGLAFAILLKVLIVAPQSLLCQTESTRLKSSIWG